MCNWVRLALISYGDRGGPPITSHHTQEVGWEEAPSILWSLGAKKKKKLTVAMATGHPRLLVSAWPSPPPPPPPTGCLSKSLGPVWTPSWKSLQPTDAPPPTLPLSAPLPRVLRQTLEPGSPQLRIHLPRLSISSCERGTCGHLGRGTCLRGWRMQRLTGCPRCCAVGTASNPAPESTPVTTGPSPLCQGPAVAPLHTFQPPQCPQHVSLTRSPLHPQPKPLALAEIQLAVLLWLFSLQTRVSPRVLTQWPRTWSPHCTQGSQPAAVSVPLGSGLCLPLATWVHPDPCQGHLLLGDQHAPHPPRPAPSSTAQGSALSLRHWGGSGRAEPGSGTGGGQETRGLPQMPWA